MATINCTNRIASPAIKAQSVWVTLNSAECTSVLPVLAVGQLVTNSNSALGIIDYVDTYGHSFRVKPRQPNFQFNSGSTNTLAVNELVTVTY